MFEDFAERWSERAKIRLVLSMIVLFFVSLAMSCQELRYMVSGKTTDATLVADQLEVNVHSDGTRSEQRVIRYAFTDNDKSRQEYARVERDYPTPEGKTIRVEYIANHELQSRLVGQHHYGWVALFAFSIIAMGCGAWLLSREK